METKFVHQDVESSTAALNELATVAEQRNYVTDTFRDALLTRESEFPTGLHIPTLDYGVAIPHADTEHVTEQALVLGIPEDAVEFRSMDDPDQAVETEMILLLLVNETDGYSSFLSQLVPLFQEESFYELVRQENGERILNMITNTCL